jgi:HEAT repeat protein
LKNKLIYKFKSINLSMNQEQLIEETLNLQTPSYLRIANIFELMNIADTQSIQTLHQVIQKDTCELVRHEAIFALGEMAPGRKSVDFLKKIIQSDNSYVVQHEALIAIGTIGEKGDIKFLKTFENHKDFEIQCSANIGIQRLTQEPGFEEEIKNNLEHYKKHLFDYKNSIQNERIQILFQLMLLGEQEIETIRECSKKDICRVVRHEAGFVLGEIGNDKSIEIMKEILELEPTPIVIHETLFALGTTGKKEALSIIKPFLQHEDYIISESANIAKDRIEKLKNPYSGVKHFA